jgi:hypothetical protein
MADIVLSTAEVSSGHGESQTVNIHICGARQIGWDISIITYCYPGGVGGNGGGDSIQCGNGGVGESPTVSYIQL